MSPELAELLDAAWAVLDRCWSSTRSTRDQMGVDIARLRSRYSVVSTPDELDEEQHG